jgi:hypothetical protein
MRPFPSLISESLAQLKDQEKREFDQEFKDKPNNTNRYYEKGSGEIRYGFE